MVAYECPESGPSDSEVHQPPDDSYYVLMAVVNLRLVQWGNSAHASAAAGPACIWIITPLRGKPDEYKAVFRTARQLVAWNAAKRFAVPYDDAFAVAKQFRTVRVRSPKACAPA